MKSMTGYGKFTVEKDGKSLLIELKAVNGRFLEINARVPKVLSGRDDIVRRAISEKIKRGNVDVYFTYENNSMQAKQPEVNLSVAAAYKKAAEILSTELDIENNFSVEQLLKNSDIVSITQANDEPECLDALVFEAIRGAVIELDKMRQTEGETVKTDLTALAGHIERKLDNVKEFAPAVVAAYREKLTSRIVDALGDVQYDEARLLNEVAFFCDKADINEEIQRLGSHLGQFNALLEANEPCGKMLDFLSQEMNREINTIGSKSNDTELTACVLEMKNTLEKIKEQIRNVE